MNKSIWFQPLSIEDFKDSSINMDKHLGIEIVEISVENKDVKIKIPDDMEASTCEEALKKWSVASGKSVELIV